MKNYSTSYFIILVCIMFFFPIFQNMACGNWYGTNIKGEQRMHDGDSDYFFLNETSLRKFLNHSKENLIERESYIKIELKKTTIYWEKIQEKDYSFEPNMKTTELLSDYALVLLHKKQTKESIKILSFLIKKYPKLYNLNSNLGTAYELAGENEKALFYIKKALEINTDSHKKSEWIHVKILEAKIALTKNPKFLQENDWLGISFGKTGYLDKIQILDKSIDINNHIPEHLEYQLSERMKFVPAPDMIVGDLLFYLADVFVMQIDVRKGLEIYAMAQKYTVSKPALLASRIDYVKNTWFYMKINPLSNIQNQYWYFIPVIAFVCILGGFLFFLRRKKKKTQN